MSTPGPAEEAREIARVLTGALAPVLAPSATLAQVTVARELAQMLELEGLDRVLAACVPHAGGPWPETFTGVIQRLARLCAAADEAGAVTPFERADLELVGLATELGAFEWAAAPADEDETRAAVPTLAATDVLDEGTVSAEERHALQRVRLTAPVAAALRAALDWLTGGESTRRLVRAHAEDAMFEVWVQGLDPMGLRAASEVLAAVDGNLGPVGGSAPPGTWRLRVPAHAAREAYLMVVQGGLPLALPWHAVIHVHLMPADEVERALPPAAVLAPLAPLAESDGERPVVMVAHGLRRAWLVADRLVWRFPADGCAATSEPPAVALDRMVRTDEGESWWRVDVARLLAGVDPLPVPEAPRPAPPLMDTRALADAAARALESARAESTRARDAVTPAPAPVEVHELTASAIEPLPGEAAPEATEPAAVPSAPRGRWRPRTPPTPPDLPAPHVEILRPAPPPPRIEAPAPPPAPRVLARAEVESLAAPAPVVVPPPAPVRVVKARVVAVPTPEVPPAVEVAPDPPAPAPVAEVPPPPVEVEPGPVAEVAPPVEVEPAPAEPAPVAEVAPPVEVAPEPPVPVPAPAAEVAPSPVEAAPAASAPALRPLRALVAEDSMMARLFLMRMLQQRGFLVDAVDSAAALVPALGRGPWGLVCLDVELPDARGAELAAGVRERLTRAGSPAALVALVRDAADIAAAHEGLVTDTLRKPFDERELVALLARLGMGEGR